VNRLLCKGLCKSFDGVVALDGVTLSFPSSGITAIIGPNGAGKSTLLNVITGFLKPDAGLCLLDALQIIGKTPNQIARFGISRTFQDLSLIHRMTVAENLALALPNQPRENLLWALLRQRPTSEESAREEKAFQVLELLGLKAMSEERVGDLSYGQQKLLSLACCFVAGSGVLLLDEPVSGVHPHVADKVLAFIQRVRAESKLVIFVEHDIAAVRKIAERVVVMDSGRVIADGGADEVLRRPELMEAYIA
jgi:ABC-type branched-subunit amino acid transport system ATPase component